MKKIKVTFAVIVTVSCQEYLQTNDDCKSGIHLSAILLLIANGGLQLISLSTRLFPAKMRQHQITPLNLQLHHLKCCKILMSFFSVSKMLNQGLTFTHSLYYITEEALFGEK
jgi:hypothetical protein